MTITEALENLRGNIKEIEQDCNKTLEEHGICDDEDLIIFALNYLSSNAHDVFYDLLTDEE